MLEVSWTGLGKLRERRVRPSAAFAHLERRRVPERPVRPSLVQRFQPPVLAGPIAPQGLVAVVDGFEEIRHGPPAELARDPGPDVEVDARDEQVAARRDQPRDAPEALLR